MWGEQGATLSLETGEEHPIGLIGIPSGSAIFSPSIVQGRNLRTDDGYAVVINNQLAEQEQIQSGDRVTLNIADRESSWTVVGTYLSVSVSDKFFIPLDALGQEIGSQGRGRRIRMLSEQDDREFQDRLIEELEDAFAVQRIEVVSSWSTSEQLEESRASFGLLTTLLLVMVILAAVVGSIGLMSTMSANVVERRREIGVMRAIGASARSIVGIFVAEGMAVGVLSWLLSLPLSYAGARLFTDLIGRAILDMPLDFVYSVGGVGLWLGIVVVLSTVASAWPALKATKISVRDALAYE
jgi:putative ABC transport system permease protein